ncbi:MAG TPA: hypothetical protein VG797_11665 [Phycisphaerales bacterium]|nr:hypothetical protein [Phycisphaerales bacterium]
MSPAVPSTSSPRLEVAGTPRANTWLLERKRDVHSQTGEDGIIEAILDTLPARDGWCVEFGAWDGLHLTNTRHLIESRDYSAVLIEGDPARAADLKRNYADNKRVTPINTFVGFSARDGLDLILSRTPIPADFDLLSIDIDGNDYHVWNAVAKYTPKIVVVEFNPTIPTPVHFVQPADPSLTQGSSLRALTELANKKGYELVCVLPFNAFYVRREYFHLFAIADNSPQALRMDESSITYLFTGFDGHVFIRGLGRLTHHDAPLSESKFQVLPRFLQRYPASYTSLHKAAYSLHRWLTRPGESFARLGRKWRRLSGKK